MSGQQMKRKKLIQDKDFDGWAWKWKDKGRISHNIYGFPAWENDEYGKWVKVKLVEIK
jgi:hypothetical protein